MPLPRLSRRAVLRGIGGAAVPLPLLEGMAAAATPLRYLVCFGGFPLCADKDPSPDPFKPDTLGAGYDLKPMLAPLAGFNNVKSAITVVSGLRIGQGASVPGGLVRAGDVHFNHNPLLTGTHMVGFQNGSVTGQSSDQFVADALAGKTTIKSLAYRVQPTSYISDDPDPKAMSVNKGYLSWRTDAGGKATPVMPTVSPKAAYDTLFTGFSSSNPQDDAKKALELDTRKSILDFVDRRMSGLLPRLGAADQKRLAQHFDEVRQIEKRLAAIPPMQAGACRPFADPGADPPQGAWGSEDIGDAVYSVNTGYSNEEVRARVLCDLVHMAFTCDLTRVATLMLTFFRTQINLEPITGIKNTLHHVTHFGKTAELIPAMAWHVKHFAYLVAKLRDTQEGGGSLLDSSAVVFLTEAGYDGASAHNCENMPCLVAGRAGGLKSGVHLAAPASANHPANVLITLMNAVGVPTTRLGEVSGAVPGLVG